MIALSASCVETSNRLRLWQRCTLEKFVIRILRSYSNIISREFKEHHVNVESIRSHL